MFLHSRAASDDFVDIIKRHREKIKGGVVGMILFYSAQQHYSYRRNLY